MITLISNLRLEKIYKKLRNQAPTLTSGNSKGDEKTKINFYFLTAAHPRAGFPSGTRAPGVRYVCAWKLMEPRYQCCAKMKWTLENLHFHWFWHTYSVLAVYSVCTLIVFAVYSVFTVHFQRILLVFTVYLRCIL